MTKVSVQLDKKTEDKINEMIIYVRTLNDKTERVVLDTISKKLDSTLVKKQVSQVKAFASATDEELRQWLINELPTQYIGGVNVVNTKLKKPKMTYEKFEKAEDTLFHRDAVNILLSDAYLDFGNTLNGVVKGAERMMTDALKQQIRANIVTGEIEGSSVRTIAKDITQTFQKEGFRAMVNRAGTQYSLEGYSEMLARTHLIKSGGEGVINRVKEVGNDLVEWSADGEGVCEICDALDGKVFSISGDSENYDELPDYPAHPNCRCALLPRPDLDIDEK